MRAGIPKELLLIFDRDHYVVVASIADQLCTPPYQIVLHSVGHPDVDVKGVVREVGQAIRRELGANISIFISDQFRLIIKGETIIDTNKGLYTPWHYDEDRRLYVNDDFIALEGSFLESIRITKFTARLRFTGETEVIVRISRDYRWSSDLRKYDGFYNHYMSFRNGETMRCVFMANGRCCEVPYDT